MSGGRNERTMWAHACLRRSHQNGETVAQSPEEEERWEKWSD